MSAGSSVTKHPPAAIETPGPGSRFDARHHARVVHRKVTTRKGWFGDYDYAWLCFPALPFSAGDRKPNRRKQPPFYGIDDELPLVLAMASGLQHALAMLAGLITPPIIFASTLALDAQTSAYMISASLIGCGKWSTRCPPVRSKVPCTKPLLPGILSLVQMSRMKLWKGYYLGTGLLTVVGTSFATLSTANVVRILVYLSCLSSALRCTSKIFNAMYANGTCPSVTAADGSVARGACPDAYGMVLGKSVTESRSAEGIHGLLRFI